MNIAELGIRIDTTGADKATSDLDKLTAAGDRAEQSTTGLMGEINALEKSLSQGAKSTQELARQRDSLARLTKAGAYNEAEFAKITKDLDKQQIALVKSTLDEQKALTSLLSAIDPAQAKLKRLDAQVEELGKHLDSGRISQQEYNKALAGIDAKYVEIDKGASAFARLGLNTRQAQENVVQLGNALSTGDIGSGVRAVVQIGAGANASAASLASMAVPATIAAAAVGTLATALIQGQNQANEFSRAIIAAGGSAGQTTQQLIQMTNAIGAGGKQNQASEAILAIVDSGVALGGTFESVARAATEMAAVTGRSSASIAEDLISNRNDVVSLAAEYNRQYHFMSDDTYDQIKALQDQGNAMGALELLTKELGDSMADRNRQIADSARGVVKVWRDAKAAFSDYWAELTSRAAADQDTFNMQVKEMNLDDLRDRPQSAMRDAAIAQIEAEIAAYKERNELNKQNTEDQQAQQAATQSRIEADQKWTKESDRYLTKEQRLEKEIAETRKQGTQAGRTDLEIEQRIAKIREQYAEKPRSSGRSTSTRTAAYTEDAGMRALDSARQQYAVLTQQAAVIEQQGLGTQKIGVQAQALIRFEQQIADIKEKRTLTADQKALLANRELITAQLQRNADLEASIAKQQQGMEAIRQSERDRIELLKLTGQALAANAAESGIVEAEQRLKFEREGNVEALKRLDTLKKIRDVNLRASQKPDTVEGVSQAPRAAGLDAVVGGAASEITRLDQSAKELSDWREKELQRQKEYLDLKAINEETYAERVSNINTQAQDNQAKIEDARNKASLENASEFFGTLATLTQSENKKLAAIGKAAAVAQATVDGFLAAQKALAAFPPPFNFVAAAAVGVATAANIASIAGVGFMDGGYTGNGRRDEVAGPVHRGEYVFDAQATSRIGVGNLEALRSGNITASAAPIVAASRAPASSGAGSPIQITQHNSYPGISSASEAKKSSAQASRDTVRAIDRARRHT